MNFIKRIFSGNNKSPQKLERTQDKGLSVRPAVVKKSIASQLKLENKPRVNLGIEELQNATEMAEALNYNSRQKLYSLYHTALKDGHVKSQIRVALNMIHASAFNFEGINTANALTLFEKKWFENLEQLIFFNELYGHSLIEITTKEQNVQTALIPREHVNPLRQEVLINPYDQKGISYQGKLTRFNLIELGSYLDLGTLEIICEQVIYKRYSRSDWSEYSEKYGMPLIKILTDSTDEDELNKYEQMGAELGASGYAIGNKDDIIELLQPQKPDVYKVYLKGIRYCDEQISKIINGQTGTSDEKSFVGSAEVHERVLDSFTESRLKTIQNTVNEDVIPLLVKQGHHYLEGVTFFYEDLKKSKPLATHQESKPKPNQLHTTIDTLYDTGYIKLNEDDTFSKLFKTLKLDEIIQRALQNIYNEPLTDDIDIDLWRSHYLPLEQTAIEQLKLEGITIKTSPEVILNIKKNLSTFAGFKTHHQRKQLVNILFKEDKIVPFGVFKKEAKPIIGQYNKHWLATEYATATKRARVTAQLKQFENTKHLYPNLEWMPSLSASPREGHKKLYHTILPIDHPFWNKNIPGNIWNCKCSLKRTDKTVTQEPTDLPTPSKGLDGDLKEGELFSKTHPYISQTKNKKNVHSQIESLPYE